MVKDLDLFRAAMADVLPLKGRRHSKVSRAPATPGMAASSGARETRPRERLAKPPVSTIKPALASVRPLAADIFTFDREVDRALSRGRRAPDAKLDLHGMTLATAERAVSRFLEEAAALDLRVVLVVTGKGLRQEGGRVFGGLIRQEFPGWLQRADNRARVRGVKAAHARHGGSGAFYVLLRRRSSASNRALRDTPQR
jgi:DNA-nicking Smr family endonuclease